MKTLQPKKYVVWWEAASEMGRSAWTSDTKKYEGPSLEEAVKIASDKENNQWGYCHIRVVEWEWKETP